MNKKVDSSDLTRTNNLVSISNSSYQSQLFFKQNINIGYEEISETPIIRSFVISVYIYYMNKNSSYMKYRHNLNNQNELKEIPYTYDLSEAGIKNDYARIVLAPLRIEPRVDKIKISKNYLKDEGIIELSKILLFNKNIRNIYIDHFTLKSDYIGYFNKILGLFDNNSVEVLDLSYNYLKEDCSEYLANILSHFKKLKAINLSINDFRRGISSFLVVLKKLYREGKTNLEKLNLSKCILDDIAYYELGELLRCKYCKLKYLYLNLNEIPSSVNFLKKVKKNKSLVGIYFNQNKINNNDSDDIMRIISNTKIECLYIYRNKISDFSQCLRIIYRTKLIKDNDKKGDLDKKPIRDDSILYNLDISNNICYNKNKNKIELLQNLCDETTLYCLDFSKILYDYNSESYKNNFSNIYTECVENLKKKLENEQDEYTKSIGDLRRNTIDKERLKNNLSRNIKDYINNIDSQIIDILQNDKASNPIFLKENARNIFNDNNEINNKAINKGTGKFDRGKQKEILTELVNYMKLKRADIRIEDLNEKINSKKFILI